jgi:hypothetical protein
MSPPTLPSSSETRHTQRTFLNALTYQTLLQTASTASELVTARLYYSHCYLRGAADLHCTAYAGEGSASYTLCPLEGRIPVPPEQEPAFRETMDQLRLS